MFLLTYDMDNKVNFQIYLHNISVFPLDSGSGVRGVTSIKSTFHVNIQWQRHRVRHRPIKSRRRKMWGKHGDIALLNPQRAATQFLESAYQLTQYSLLHSSCLFVWLFLYWFFVVVVLYFLLIYFFRISPTNYSEVDRELIDSLSVL